MKRFDSPINRLKETPWWRWVFYCGAFGAVIIFLGLKVDRHLLWVLPLAVSFTTILMIALLHFTFTAPRFRSALFGFGHLLGVGIGIAVAIQWASLVGKIIDHQKRNPTLNQVVPSKGSQPIPSDTNQTPESETSRPGEE